MKKNGFISKQVQKLMAPIIYDCLHICYELVQLFTEKEFMSYDDYTNLCDKVNTYDKFEVYILEELKKRSDN